MIYSYRATILENKVFCRVYEVREDMTLFNFNTFMTDDLGFSPDQMVFFEGYDSDGELHGRYGLFDMGDGTLDKITFADLLSRGEVEIRYYFDIRHDRFIKLVFESESAISPMRPYPCLVEEKGQNPNQFTKGTDEYQYEPRIPSKSRIVNDPDPDDEDFDDEDDDDEDDNSGEDEIFDAEEVYEP